MTMPNFEGDDDDYDGYGWFGQPSDDDEPTGWGMCGRPEKEENLEYGWGEQSKTKKPMGDIADMHADAFWDDPDELYDIGYYRARKELRCRSCGKRELFWRKVSGNWIMMEQDNKVHQCEGYEPPLESLKVIADEILKETRKETLWKLKDKAKERGGLTKLINIITDEQLLDLYTSFVKDEQRNYDEPDIGMPISYGREISFLKKEILRRMN